MLKREGTGTTGVPTIPISWWSWRPGMRPGNALLLGIPLTFLSLLLIMFGAITLSAGIEDSSSPPLQVPATVITRMPNKATGQAQLMLLLQKTAGIPTKATFTLASNRAIPLNAPVTVSFSPRLHVAYALEYAGQRYALQGASAAGNLPGSIIFMLLGLLLLPYPALLVHWGWRDLLLARYERGRLSTIKGRVVALRETTRSRQPGFAGRGARLWYGLALQPAEEPQKIHTFSISEETYRSLQKGMPVRIVYSPHLHYVYTITETNPFS
ncbi:MAG: hypothetical protein M3Y39_02760 [Chloroflexota bacterium]|nr:hypothetical protein [Chloroflexota bacterium]